MGIISLKYGISLSRLWGYLIFRCVQYFGWWSEYLEHSSDQVSFLNANQRANQMISILIPRLDTLERGFAQRRHRPGAVR